MLTSHCFGDYVVETNDKWFKGLSADHQKVIQDAATSAAAENEKAVKDADAKLAQQLADKGMTIVPAEKIARADYIKIVQEKSIPRYENAWGKGFYDEIMKVAG